MPDDKQPSAAEAKANAEEIKDVDATVDAPRGNVISEEEDAEQAEGPPPLPN